MRRVAGYSSQIQVALTAKWGVQIANIFQTRSNLSLPICKMVRQE